MITAVRFLPGALALTLVLLPLTAPGQQRDRLVDGIAAVVNSNAITFGQVRELLMFRQRSLSEIYQGDELRAKMKESQDAALKDLIDRQLIMTANRHHHPLLENAEELGLELEFHLADFVEEEGTAGGLFESSDASLASSAIGSSSAGTSEKSTLTSSQISACEIFASSLSSSPCRSM